MSDKTNASDRELLQEVQWRLCVEDETYFLTNFMVIPTPKRGRIKIPLRPAQEAAIEALVNYDLNIILKARQIGYTTIAYGHAFWDAFFHPDRPWLVVSTGETAAKKVIERLKVMYKSLPPWMRERGPKLVTDSKESIAFDNGSRIEALPSTAATGRGDAVYGVIFDEAAHMDKAEEVFGALDPLCYGPMLVISTAKGMGNWFHDKWLDSQTPDSEWHGLFFPWHAVESRDAAWYERTKRKYRGEEWLFYQEYPSTPEEAFARSGRPAVGDDLLAGQDWRVPDARYNYVPQMDGLGVWELWGEAEDSDVMLHVWEEPTVERHEDGRLIRPPNYTLFCDTAEGLDHGDYTAVTVWNANTDECVATLRTRYPIEDLGELLESLGYRYHTALIVVERNNHGMVPLVYLTKSAHYPRVFRMPKLARQIREEARRLDYGWITSTRTKPKMVADFIKGLRDGRIKLHDSRFRIESSTFVADGKGGYGATTGNHDDLVIAHLGGYQGVLDVGRYPIVWYDDTEPPVTVGEFLTLTSQTKSKPHPLDRKRGNSRSALPSVPWPS